jgi:hypothetical protein
VGKGARFARRAHHQSGRLAVSADGGHGAQRRCEIRTARQARRAPPDTITVNEFETNTPPQNGARQPFGKKYRIAPLCLGKF